MSDKEKAPESGVQAPDTEPAPAPDAVSIGGVPMALVKGGTTSSSYDRAMQKSAHDENVRRAHADKQAAIAARPKGPGEIARLGDNSFMRGAPRAVFFYLNRDGTVKQECVSEVTMVEGAGPGQMDLMFTIVCPRCLERGVPQGQAQCQVRSSHRRFHIREDRHVVKMGTEQVALGKGEVVQLTTPWGHHFRRTPAVRWSRGR